MRIALTALSALLVPSSALACGGFFCGTDPVDQTGEDILFASDGETIEAHVRIQYQGDEDAFAWVVPVPGVPELDVGSDQLFATLGWLTQPWWNYELGETDCAGPWLGGGWGDEFDDADSDGLGNDPSPPSSDVEVLAEQAVGAYQAVVVSATNAQSLLDWLNCNGYRVAYGGLPMIEHYLGQGMNFLGLKLRGGATANELTPIVMRYQATDPMIPIVLTAVATQPNLRIRAWVLGQGRTVPTNYDHVWVNEARVVGNNNWWGNTNWYTDLVGAAVDEVGGQAFVTDYAGPSAIAHGMIVRDGGWDTNSLRSLTDPAAFVQQALAIGLPRNATMQQLLRNHIPMPQSLVDQGVDERSFYNNLQAYSAALAGQPFDPDAFVDDIVELIVAPLERADALFRDGRFPTLTRMTTTLSGWEMTVDPMFKVLDDPLTEPPGPVAQWPWSGGVPTQRTLLQDFEGHPADPSAKLSCWNLAATIRSNSPVKPVLQFPNLPDAVFPDAAELPSCQDLPAFAFVERWDDEGNVVLRHDNRPDIAAAAPAGYCVADAVPPQPLDPPDGTEWEPPTDLMPLQDIDPAVCEALESGTVVDEPWTPTGDNPDENLDAGMAPDPSSCSGCAQAPARPAWFALLLLPLVRRRR